MASLPTPLAATATVIVNALADVGLDAVVGSRTRWVNVTREFLLSGAALPPDRVVLELVEDQRVDRALLSALRELAASGFAIALDDFEYTSRAQTPLLDVAQIVKLDVRALVPVALASARLGTDAVRCKAKLLSPARLRDGPDVAIDTAPVRARMASQLAASGGGVACPDRAFTVGLLSLIDALLHRPFGELTCELPFDGQTMGAPLERSGPEGSLLDASVAHERGRVPVGVDPRVLARSHRSATAWADALQPQLA